MAKSSKIDHPKHYGGDTTYEAIKVIRAWGLNFATGNAAKYLCRAGKKGSTLENLQKARWYLDDEIKTLEARPSGRRRKKRRKKTGRKRR